MKVVAPTPKELRGKLLQYPRLYAYPTEPEPPHENEFIILDSGAFALSKQGRSMGVDWMRNLGDHYRQYQGSDRAPIIAMAPDVFLDPQKTMSNFTWWHNNINRPVAPVIQFKQKKKLDIAEAVRQAQFYAQYQPHTIAISNPGLIAAEAQEMAAICRIVRQVSGAQWLHNLGAGWDYRDVIEWGNLGFDSIDSVVYYEDAKRKLLWQKNTRDKVYAKAMKYEALAIANFDLSHQASLEARQPATRGTSWQDEVFKRLAKGRQRK